jgi:hypothetical protein
MYRKSMRAIRKERKAKKCAAMRAAKERKRLSGPPRDYRMAFTVRVMWPDTGAVKQAVVFADGEHVWIDGRKARTFRGFCAAMNRRLWATAERTCQRRPGRATCR